MTHPVIVAQAIAVKQASDMVGETGFANMPGYRYAHGMVIKNDKISAVGGKDQSGAATSTHYQYDIMTNTWTTKNSISSTLFQPNLAFSSADGLLHMVGYYSSASSIAHATWDSTTDTWDWSSPSPPYSSSLNISDRVLLELPNGLLHLYIGTGANSHQAYDVTARTWTAKASGTLAASGPACVVSGLLFVGYNTDLSTYDYQTNTWTARPKTPQTIDGALGSDFGGNFTTMWIAPSGSNITIGVSYIFDLATSTWRSGPVLPDGYAGGAGRRQMAKASDGSYWAAGGFSTGIHGKVVRIKAKSEKDKAIESLQALVHAF